jgi:hypothetical protein
LLTQEEILSASPEKCQEMLIQVTSLLPLLVAGSIAKGSSSAKGDRLLGIEEAAALLGYENKMSLYRAQHRYPFVVRDGGRLMFSEKGLHEWIGKRTRGK